MLALRTILVAVDFSDTSDDAVRYARELAQCFAARILLLHVIPDPLQQPWAIEAPGLDFPGLADQWRGDARARLGALVTASNLDPSLTGTAVEAGLPHRVIVEYARVHGADLVVLGSHGHSPVVHFLLGSVAEKVVRQSTTPVLIVPHHTLRSAKTAPDAVRHS